MTIQDPHEDHNPLDQFVTNINRDKEEELTSQKAASLGLAYKNMSGFQPEPSAVILVPKELAESGHVFAFAKSGNNIDLAIADPNAPGTVTALTQLASMDEYVFKPYLVSGSSMRYLLGVYDTFAPKTTNAKDIEIVSDIALNLSDIKNLSQLEARLAEQGTSENLELILAGAIALNASDIHIEPESTAVRLRYRLDGVLQDIATLESSKLDSLVDRIKIQSSLKLNLHEVAQDGRFSVGTKDGPYDLRISILPTQYGESVVIRLLPQKGKFISLEELGFGEADMGTINSVITQPDGLILNTGPTGSGKTTTLYAILAKLNQPDRKIVTIEDPIEYRLDGITQTQVNPEEDYTFANALRAIVRQDPDVVLVGEIRDSETADITINASLTGHLVLSTLHTNDAAGSVARLVELEAKPNIFADALRLIIAQRLMRRLCPTCKKSHPITPEETEQLKKISSTAALPTAIFEPVGCDECNQTGYRGRLAIYELLRVTPEIKNLIATQANGQQLTDLAIQQGMTPLGAAAIAKITDGTSSLSELLRVVES